MPNDVDQSRIGATTDGGVVVNLDEYRAQAGTRTTALPYIPPNWTTPLSLGAVVFLVLLWLMLRRA